MSEPEIEKGKKRRRRSARVYVNANKPLAVDVPEIAALFPPDDDDDAKGLSVTDPLESSEKHAGNSVPNTYSADRLSAPLTAGHQDPATGDHGVGAGRNQSLAQHFLDLRQSTTTWTPLARRVRAVRWHRPVTRQCTAVTTSPGTARSRRTAVTACPTR